jgi:hypothetical protein
VGTDDELLKQHIAERACKMQKAVNSDRQHGKIGSADPACRYRLEGKNKQVKKIGPQYLAVNGACDLQQVVVIGPVGSDHYETDHIASHNGKYGNERMYVISLRQTDFENRNCNNDSDHTVAECFQSSFGNNVPPVFLCSFPSLPAASYMMPQMPLQP